MSEVKVNKISPRTACGTVTVGDSGDAVTVSAGVPVTVTDALTANTVTVPGNVVKSNAYQAADAGNIISQSGTTVTLGASGDTVALASGASQSGFGRAGSVDWQTGSIKTATFSAVDGEGYFCNTTGGAFTVNLPAGSAGAIVAVNDYAGTAASNNITLNPNGAEKIQGSDTDRIISTDGVTLTLVYVDGTQGWKLVDSGEVASMPQVAVFTTATGGNSCATTGDYKWHIFTGPGTFCVSKIGNVATNPLGGPAVVDYMVVAGGGSGSGSETGGGGGAGGFRESHSEPVSGPYTASPLATATGITVTASPYSIVVGAGGPGPGNGPSGNGSTSTFSTIDSAGGGGGANSTAGDGGSGGGGGRNAPGEKGSGNTPPVSPPQGNDGGRRYPFPSPGGNPNAGGGGGGAAGTGDDASSPQGGNGGSGTTTSITNSPTVRAGGGGGGAENGSGGSAGPGGGAAGTGAGGGVPGNAGTINTGGGGGGTGWGPGPTPCGGGPAGPGGAGGSGIVVIRYKYQ